MQVIANTMMNFVQGLMPRIQFLLLPSSHLLSWTNLVFSIAKKQKQKQRPIIYNHKYNCI